MINAILIVAWSEGKLASGKWSNNNFAPACKCCSGLSITINCWIVREVIIASTIQ